MRETDRISLLNSAKELYLKYGVKSVSMDDIAKLLGISKKTIYNIVSNKQDLVHAAVGAYIQEEEKTYQKLSNDSDNALDEIISIARHAIKALKKIKPNLTYDLKKYHPKTWTIVEQDHFLFIEQSITSNLKRGIKEGYYRPDLRIDILPKLYVSLTRLVIDNDIFQGQNISQVDIYNTIIKYHLNGIITNKGRKELEKHLNQATI